MSPSLIGLSIALVVLKLLPLLAPAGVPRIDQVRLDATAIGFTVMLSLIAAVVAERPDPASEGNPALVAVGRIQRTEPGEAEFSLLVADAYQGRGLGTELLRRLVQIGRQEGLRRITAMISSGNGAMQAVARKLGFEIRGQLGEPTVDAVLEL